MDLRDRYSQRPTDRDGDFPQVLSTQTSSNGAITSSFEGWLLLLRVAFFLTILHLNRKVLFSQQQQQLSPGLHEYDSKYYVLNINPNPSLLHSCCNMKSRNIFGVLLSQRGGKPAPEAKWDRSSRNFPTAPNLASHELGPVSSPVPYPPKALFFPSTPMLQIHSLQQ